MQKSTSSHKQPIEHNFRRLILRVYFHLDVQILLFAFQAYCDKLLVKSIELQERVLVKHFADILDAIFIDQGVELLLFQDLQLDVHFAVLADRFNLLFFDLVDDIFEIQILFGQIVPINGNSFGNPVSFLISDDAIGILKKLVILFHLILIQFFLLYFLPFLDHLPLQIAFVVFVLIDEFVVVQPEIFLGEYFVEIVDDPGFIEIHEVIFDCVEFEILGGLVYFEVFVYFAQLLADGVGLFSLVEF